MSYQNQMAQLVSEFQKAGLPRQNAVAIGRILGNSLQEMRRGPETKDVTSPRMRQVTGQRRKQEFKNLDFQQGDPDYRKGTKQSSENKPRPVRPSTVQDDKDPVKTDNYFNVEAGPFVIVEPNSEGVEVGLRIVGTEPIMTQDSESGAIVGKRIRCNAGQQEGLINFNLESRDDEYILNLSLDLDAIAKRLQEIIEDASEDIEQITGQPGGGGLSNAFVNVTLGASGLCFQRVNGSQMCVAVTTCSTDGD